MLRRILIIAVVGLLLAAGVHAVLAAASGLADQDTYVVASQPNNNYNGGDLAAAGSLPTCNPTYISYLQWDLVDVPGGATIGSAVITLTVRFTSGVQPGTLLSLYETGDYYLSTTTLWTEGGLTFNNAPGAGTLIQSIPAPTAFPSVVTFNNAALATYLNNEAAGDDLASFALGISGTCSAGATIVGFEDSESASGGPMLLVQSPSAIEVRNARVQAEPQDVPASLPVFVLGVPTLAAVASLLWRRRRG